MSFIMALDQGTTSSRAILFDRAGSIIALAQREFEQLYPAPGWVEHDANKIWSTQAGVMAEVIERARIRAADIAAIGITNQRETTVVWDRSTGQPVCNAIVWQDRRTAAMCDRLRAQGAEAMVREKTGLVIDAYFSGTKIAWILEHVDGARERAERGELAFGTIDTWLIWNLTAGNLHLTDASNASRTMLCNIHTRTWDDELLDLLRIPRGLLPDIRSNSEVYGEVAAGLPLEGIPIACMIGDQQGATMGQICDRPGMAKCTYGTGCFLLLNTGPQPQISDNKLLSTIAWQRDGVTTYALEGSVFIGGAVVQWLRDGLKIIRDSSQVEALARSVEDNGGVYLVPAFAGLGAPHWDAYARGTILGITRGTTDGHIARAALEAIAYQVADLAHAMERGSDEEITELRVDGGAAANDLLMQFQADILGIPVVRPTVLETTALGAAYLAGLAVGYWESPEQIAENWQIDRRFEPAMPAQEAERLRHLWRKAVGRSMNWIEADNT